MRKIWIFSILSLSVLTSCSKPDPVLPGERTAIFSGAEIIILNQEIAGLPENITAVEQQDCPYTQDSSNVVWGGDKKIFSGFPTSNSVYSYQKPVCHGGFVYAGLTTGELVKIQPRTRNIEWIADIYRSSNLTGGAGVLDIVAPVVPDGGHVYVGGLGNAFCKIQSSNGNKKWCTDISVGVSFIIVGPAAFVVDTANHLYAINTNDGSVYWRGEVKRQRAPVYKDGVVAVGRHKFVAATGAVAK